MFSLPRHLAFAFISTRQFLPMIPIRSRLSLPSLIPHSTPAFGKGNARSSRMTMVTSRMDAVLPHLPLSLLGLKARSRQWSLALKLRSQNQGAAQGVSLLVSRRLLVKPIG